MIVDAGEVMPNGLVDPVYELLSISLVVLVAISLIFY